MPRDSNGLFYYSPGNEAVTNEPVRSAQFNTRMAEIKTDLNTMRPISQGGTAAATATAARANLGVRAIADTPGLSLANVYSRPQTIDTTDKFKLNLMGGTAVGIFASGMGTLEWDDATGVAIWYLTPKGTSSGASLQMDRLGGLSLSGQTITHSGNLDDMLSTVTTPGGIAFLQSTVAAALGATVAGSALKPAGINSAGALYAPGTALSGQWRAVGACPANGATLFVRIS